MRWTKPLSQILNSPEMGSLGQRVAAYERLKSVVQNVLPPVLRGFVLVSPIQDERLVIRCANGTVHLRLRVLIPHIIEAIRSEGLVLKEVRLKVEPIVLPKLDKTKSIHRVIPESGRAALERARQRCDGTPLAEAIARLLKHSY